MVARVAAISGQTTNDRSDLGAMDAHVHAGNGEPTITIQRAEPWVPIADAGIEFPNGCEGV